MTTLITVVIVTITVAYLTSFVRWLQRTPWRIESLYPEIGEFMKQEGMTSEQTGEDDGTDQRRRVKAPGASRGA